MHTSKHKLKRSFSYKVRSRYANKQICSAMKSQPALPVAEELNLQSIDFPDELPTNIMFPEELNRFLQNRIRLKKFQLDLSIYAHIVQPRKHNSWGQLHIERTLSQENGQLRRSLEERESELQEYIEKESKSSSLTSVLSGPPNRVAEMAAVKITDLSKRVRELTAEMESYKSKYYTTETKLKKLESQSSELIITKPKKEPCKSQVEEQKIEEDVRSLTDRLSATNAKLCEFRNQCQQLKQDLKVAQKVLSNEIGENVSIHDLTTGNANWRGRAQQIISLQQKVSELQTRLKDQDGSESKRMQEMKELEKERKALVENLEQLIKDRTEQLEKTKKKLEGVQSRDKILEGDLRLIKTKLKTVLDKSSHDDQLISRLTDQLNVQEKKLKQYEVLQRKSSEKLEVEKNSLEQDLKQEKARMKELQSQLAERESRLDVLERRLAERADNLSQHRLSRVSSRESDSNLYATRLERTDQQNSNVHYQVLCKAAEGERVRLLELLAVNNRRLEQQRKKAEEAEDALMSERKKCARMEIKLARLELEKAAATNRFGSYRNTKRTEKESAIPDQIVDKIELLQEECNVLRTRLGSVIQEREEDLKNYANMLDNTKKTFLSLQKDSQEKLSPSISLNSPSNSKGNKNKE